MGTHIDAPSHCFEGAHTIADIPLSQLITPCVVLDVSQKSHAALSVSETDILEFENRWGKIPTNSTFLIYTGWDRYWSEPQEYRNGLRFPSLSESAAALLRDRKVAAVGIDTLGVDRPDSGFPAHRILLGAGILIIENLTQLNQMPPMGGSLICLPIKASHLTEAPARVIGVKTSSIETNCVNKT